MPAKDIPVQVHDVAYMENPVPAAVSRATLHPWCEHEHPDGAFMLHGTALARCMQNAVTWAEKEVPDFHHGLLVHAVQKYEDGTPEVPRITTLRQYASAYTSLGCIPLDPPFGTPGRAYVLLVPLESKRRVPRWVWHRLGADLLYPSGQRGDAPPAL